MLETVLCDDFRKALNENIAIFLLISNLRNFLDKFTLNKKKYQSSLKSF